MSVPITTFDHENWTEPHISFEELVSGRRTYLSRQDEEVSAYRRSIAASQKTIGILTKTITASPIIRYVLTASLWERRHWRDTIFVGETFVSIKTFHPDALSAGHLEDVVTISNFRGARILSAKVIGAPSNTTLEDTPRDDEHTLHGKGWPWNILVLALSSCELLFLTGNRRDGPRSTFAKVWKPLPRNVSRMEQYGHFMAVDPSSRCMAISCAQNFFGIMLLKSCHQIKGGRHGDKLLDPVKKEKFFRVDGSILAMEFLYPPKRLSDTIILALLAFQDGCKLNHLIYTFDFDKGLSTVTSTSRELFRYPTGYYDPPPPPPIPIMMIPVTLPASYILATPLQAILCKDALTELPFTANELVPPNSRWVAWARPQRIGKWNTRHDDVYVCSDDGQLLFLSIGRSGDFTITPVDMIGTSLDTAFGILDAGPNKQNGDILVAAGSLGEGALFIAPARSTIQVVQRLPNWGPVCDCLVIPTKAFDIRWSGTAYEPQPRHRLFVCATNGDCRGSLTEMRHGFEAKIGFEIECGVMYPRNMFVLPEADHCGKGIYVMITELVGSTLLYIAALGDDARVVDEEELGLDLKGETIMAGVTPSGILTHVTERELRMTRLDQNKKKVKHVFNSRIVAASIGANNHVATAMRDDAANTTTVEIRHIDSSFETCSLRVPSIRPSMVQWEPVSLMMDFLGDQLWLFAGTTDGRLMAVTTNQLNDWKEIDVKPSGEDNANAVESIKTFGPHNNDRNLVILCGLRCGWIIPIVMQARPQESVDMRRLDPWKFGETSARLSGLDQDRTFAIITCGAKMWRMEMLRTEKDNPTFVAEPIWVTDHNNPAFMSPEVFASAMVNTGKCPKTPNGLLNGSLAICTADHVMICNLSLASKVVPRAVFLPGSPEKMIYSPRLNRIVVASSVREKKLEAGHVLSWTRPQLDFLDPDSTNPYPFEFKSDETSHKLVETEVPRLRGAAGEKVTALLEWRFKFGEMSHTFIVLATQTPYVSDKDSRLRGYLHFLRARFSQKYPEEVESVAKHRLAFEEPVRSCCPYGDSGLLVTYGKTVRIVVLDQQTRHFLPGPEFALETEATSVSEEKGFIYIMTSRSSLLVLAEQGQGSGQLRLLAQAGCDKAGLDHIQFGSLPVVLTSHRGGNIVGYAKRDRYHPALRLLDSVFVANLTSSVRYLRDLPPAHSKVQTCGVALDGTVFKFTALEERQWRLLKFLQNLCMPDNLTTSRVNKTIDLFSDDIGKKENLQVDGDTLSKLVDRGSSYLRRKLESPMVKDGEDDVMDEGEGVHRRTKRFEELARPLFSNSQDPDLCRTVIAWVRDLVQVR